MRLLARAGNRNNSQRTKGKVMKHQENTPEEMIEVIQGEMAGKIIQLTNVGSYIPFESRGKGYGYNFERCKYRVKPEPRAVWVTFDSDGTVYDAVSDGGNMLHKRTYEKFTNGAE